MVFDFYLSCAFAVVTLILIWWMRTRTTAQRLPTPPGPKGLPFIGNIHQLPLEGQELLFAKWGKEFGDIVFVKFFGTPALILNSYEAAEDLLIKRSALYSHRPPFIALKELIGWTSMLPLMQYDSQYRKMRAWFSAGVSNKTAVEGFKPLARRETYGYLAWILKDPDAWEALFAQYGAAMMLDVAYGYKVTSPDDELVKIASLAMNGTARSGDGFGLILDFLPILKHWPAWMPGSTLKSLTNATRTQVNQMRDLPFKWVLSNMEKGVTTSSFLQSLLEKYMQKGAIPEAEEFDIKSAAATVYGAGTDTMTVTLMTLMMAMVKFPEAYYKAQQELDRVVGHDRLPEFEDRDSLPYLNAFLLEVYRWHPPLLLALPHRILQDDVYRGYHIPAGTVVIPNVWNMSQDESKFLEPEKFRPERFLGPNPETEVDPKDFAFGFGRRVCPGKDFADSSSFLLAACIISTMDVARAKDDNGVEIDPPLEFYQGVTNRPKSFSCRITPRSQKSAELINQMHELTKRPRRGSRLPLPPGPAGLPFIGNIHQLPVENQEVVFSQWAKEYGDVVFARFFGVPVIILNSVGAAQDLLVKRSGNYSDRPAFVAMRELVGWDTMLPLLTYVDQRFKKIRTWFKEILSSKVASNRLKPLQRRETYTLLNLLLTRPEEYTSHLVRFGGSVLLDVAYAYKVVTDDDPLLQAGEAAMHGTALAGSGFGLILDFFPTLKHWPMWLPGSGFKRTAKATGVLVDRLKNVPYNKVVSDMAKGKASSCFLVDLLETHLQRGPISDSDVQDIKTAAATVYGAGTDAMSVFLINFILAMVKHPDVLRRAQDEIDRVVGHERLPDFDDRASLPYLDGVLRETFRWHPTFLLGLPHRSMQDDEYMGYRIPGGAIVLANIWHMSQNKAEFPNPHEFRPERYIGPDPESKADPREFAFGFGRRGCPGKSFADSSVFLLVANIVATMNLAKAKDENGVEIDPPFEFEQGVTR
ncbi:hypothetical protein EIP91_001107 [Steccherinum ochraceum]|uniref:Cytochrome P450 n=1 Tax=Steccherinum ochraceum TaxID=92696 RepID=A0A4R0REJ7_9APHY|nr:hypothetical protein EIP91_001107 [Steccherinum ochraceum]